MRKLWGAAVAAVFVCLFSGCSAPAPAPTVTVTAEAAPAPTVTVTVTATPVPAAAAPAAPTSNDERLAELRTVSQQVTGVEETEPGRWIVHTSITDPGAGISGSPGAEKAIAVCEKAVALGAAKVVVTDADGSSWVLYGHPSYGNTCTEV